jgi:hypothetical protein
MVEIPVKAWVPAALQAVTLLSANVAVTAANDVVLDNIKLAPYKDTDHCELETEKLIKFPITYSPGLKDELAKVMG